MPPRAKRTAKPGTDPGEASSWDKAESTKRAVTGQTGGSRAATEVASDPSASAEMSQPVGSPSFVDLPRLLDAALIGGGGMGSVHRAFDKVLRRWVAVKRMHAEAHDDADQVRQFVEEARVTGQLDHPNIVPVYDLSENGAPVYFTMKLVSGKTLATLVEEAAARQASLDELRSLVGVLIRICDALAFAHSRGVVHCDIKPQNIMVGTHGQVFLMDWGIAVRTSSGTEAVPTGSLDTADGESPSSLASSYSVVGTPAYMAPEQLHAQSDGIGPHTDIYGLGAVLYQVLTGRPPSERRVSLFAQADDDSAFPQVSDVWPQLPPGLCSIAARALRNDPADRYGSIEELKAELEQFLMGGGWLAVRHYEAGSLIVKEGDPAHEAFIIVEGRCEVFKTAGGAESPIRQLGPGDVFGETAVFARKARSASVRALEPVTTRVITQEALDQELKRNPCLSVFVTALAERFLDVDSKLSEATGAKSAVSPDSAKRS